MHRLKLYTISDRIDSGSLFRLPNGGKTMLQYVNVKDLRANASHVLEMTRKGKTVIVTRRGKPEAIMFPFGKDKKVYVRMLMDELVELFEDAGINQKKALKALEEVRINVYG